MTIRLLVVSLAVAFAALSPAAQAETWDFAGDFRPNNSGNSTPDRYGHPGVWSYRLAPSNDAFEGFPLSKFTTQPFGAGYPYLKDVYAWAADDGVTRIFVGVKLGDTGSCVAPQTCTLRNGDGYMHPSDAYDAVARWTSPIAGTVRLTGVMQSVDGNGTGMTYRVTKNSATQSSGSIAPTGPGSTFDLSTTVAVGDTIDFRIGSGGSATSDGMKVDFTVARPIPSCDNPTITGSGTIDGTEGDDVIVGSDGGDLIRGYGGNDKICARGGNDTVRADGGNDEIDLGAGDDYYLGEQVAFNSDRIWGGGGADNIAANTSDRGLDRVLYDDAAGPVTIRLGTQTTTNGGVFDGTGDTIGDSIESVTGSPGADALTAAGGVGNHTIYGETGSDLIEGGPGADFLAGGRGGDTFTGGAGSDRVSYRQAGAGYSTSTGVTVSLNGLADDGLGTDLAAGLDGVSSSNRDNISSDVEYLFGGTGNDTLDMSGYVGGFPASSPAPTGIVASGWDGNDTLFGTPNRDYLEGGVGADTAYCTSGDILVTIEVKSGC